MYSSKTTKCMSQPGVLPTQRHSQPLLYQLYRPAPMPRHILPRINLHTVQVSAQMLLHFNLPNQTLQVEGQVLSPVMHPVNQVLCQVLGLVAHQVALPALGQAGPQAGCPVALQVVHQVLDPVLHPVGLPVAPPVAPQVPGRVLLLPGFRLEDQLNFLQKGRRQILQ